MHPFPWIDVLVIAVLVVVNALFALSELAIVSARPARLKVAAEAGSGGAAAALQLASNPGRFLSTVQAGITLIGIVAGAYSGASLGGPVAERLEGMGLSHEIADELGFVLVIGLTTYFNLVVGELVPKQIALRAAEPIAKVAARPMVLLSKVFSPFVWALDRSSALLIRLFGISTDDRPAVSADELHMIFAEATHSGVIEEDERAIMSGIMRLADRPAREVMTPRTELHFLECDADPDEIRAAIAASPHSLMPITDGSIDRVIGVLKVRDLQAALLRGEPLDLRAQMRKPAIVPDQIDTMEALRVLQQAEVAMALVHDEYGHLEGVVTPADLLSAIVGNFVAHRDDGDEPMVVEREDGSLLIAGALPADALADRLGLELPDDRDYATAAGFVLSVLKRLPQEGEHFAQEGWRIEIVDMDGRKIDKLLVSRQRDPAPGEAGG